MKNNPKIFKFGRVFRKKLKSNDIIKTNIFFTQYKYGLKALECGKLKLNHFNMINLLIKQIFKKNANYRVPLGLLTPVTYKPVETRMGKGKGERQYWECSVLKGMLIIEINSISQLKIKYLFKLIKERLPFKVKLVKFIY